MATSLFMKIDGIEGQCSDSAHKGWIEISHFSFGAFNLNEMGDSYLPQLTTCSSGASPIRVGKMVDGSSTEILSRVMLGNEIKKVEFASCLMQEGKVTDFLKVELERCSITAFNFGMSNGDGHIPEDITFTFGKFTITVAPIKDKDGKTVCGKTVMGYDLIENKNSEARGG
ncbi:TPA: type VI secretion system tube protein Hcp [Salmonella enterica]|uniref:Type VI secretion system tube protein Hcp n=1 Tax=Salmonella enterica TaxID=28901 RepID=A0A747SP64_SALER|nr:type VI secretion system tube protein Hcp [Salmonella enterica]HAF4697591.1 type VI secretion system tube protein Hcp [Salmonella enterica]